MTPDDFIPKWRGVTLKERAPPRSTSSTCAASWTSRRRPRPTPTASGTASRRAPPRPGAATAGRMSGSAPASAGSTRARARTSKAAFKQLQLYTPALEYPPLLIVSRHRDRIVIHTAFTGTVPDVHDPGPGRPARRRPSAGCSSGPSPSPSGCGPARPPRTSPKRRPGASASSPRPCAPAGMTPGAVGALLHPAPVLPVRRGHRAAAPTAVHPAAGCRAQATRPALPAMLEDLFGAMATGGRIGFEPVDWFNGGLFDSADALPLEPDDIKTPARAGRLDWSAIEPSIFGTLFERGLDPDKRSPTRRPLHRPRLDHAPGGPGGPRPAAGRVGRAARSRSQALMAKAARRQVAPPPGPRP